MTNLDTSYYGMLSEKAKHNKSSGVLVEVTDENGVPLLFTYETHLDYRGGFVKQNFIKWDLLHSGREYNLHFYIHQHDDDVTRSAMRSLFESMEHLSHAGIVFES